MLSHRVTAARPRRKIYFYIFVIVSLFVLHFIVSQDFVIGMSPNRLFRVNTVYENVDISDIDDWRLNEYNTNNKLLSPSFYETNSRNDVYKDNFKGPRLHNKNVRWNPNIAKINASDTFGDEDKTLIKYMRQSNEDPSHAENLSAPYSPPPNEKPKKRFPHVVIIGFAKCGTRALLEFLSLHPFVVNHDAEMHFYDRDDNFKKGLEWYRNQMPLSYSNQITIEKTPAYIRYQRARDEMYKLNPNVKLIVLVRDPVVRLVSQYLLKYRNVLPYKDIPVNKIYTDPITGEFNPDFKPVFTGVYYKHMAMWLERFRLKQFLILNGELLTSKPIKVLKQVEAFLKIPPLLEERNFYFNESSGFFCPRGFEKDAIPQCLGRLKGMKHPKLPPDDEKMLYDFYRPLNEKFFQLVNQRFVWKEREWARYQR